MTCDNKKERGRRNFNNHNNNNNNSEVVSVSCLFPMKTTDIGHEEFMLWDGSCTHSQDRSCTGHGDAFSATNREPQVCEAKQHARCDSKQTNRKTYVHLAP